MSIVKKIAQIFLAFAIAISTIPISAALTKAEAASNPTVKQIAEAELDNRYQSKYSNYRNAWCLDFAMWCARQAGAVNLPNVSSCSYLAYNYNGRWHRVTSKYWSCNGLYERNSIESGYIPAVGDIVLVTGTPSDPGPYHAGIVTEVNRSSRTFTYIAGNDGSLSRVNKHENVSFTGAKVWGFWKPEYTYPQDSVLGTPVNLGDSFIANIVGVDGRNLDIDDYYLNVKLTSANRNSDPAQQWQFTRSGDGYYFIKNVSTGKYLDVYTGGSGTNHPIIQWGTSADCNDAAMQWYIHSYNGKYVFKARCSDTDIVADIFRDYNDQAATFQFHGGENQLFSINKVNESWGRVEFSVDKPEITVYQKSNRTDKENRTHKIIKLDCDTRGANIYYTTDGTTPTKNSKHYVNHFRISRNSTLKVVAYKNGSYSEVVTLKVKTVEMKYDVDGNNVVDNRDLEALSDYLLGLRKYICIYNADSNYDGEVSLTDLSKVNYYLLGIAD